MENVDGTKGEIYVIDPKAMDKDSLYGTLDGTTMEWTDGVFTSLLRTILDNQKGESDRRHWIIFDGDVDPEWAENLNRYVAMYVTTINKVPDSHFALLQCFGRQQTLDFTERGTTSYTKQCQNHS